MVASKVVDNPRVRRPHQELAFLGSIPDVLRSGSLELDRIGVVENPLGLGRREVGVTFEPSFVADFLDGQRVGTLVLDFFDAVGGASILPDQCVVHWFAGFFVPDNRGFTLIGDPDRLELGGIDAAVVESLVDDEFGVFPDFHRVVLDPAGLRVDLFVFLIGLRYDIPVMVKDDETGSSRSLVD